MSYHSHNLGGGKSIYWSILEARGTIHVQFSGLPVASCLAVSKRDGKQLCSTLDESPKWGASPPILMRSPRMESLKQLDSSFFTGRFLVRPLGKRACRKRFGGLSWTSSDPPGKRLQRSLDDRRRFAKSWPCI